MLFVVCDLFGKQVEERVPSDIVAHKRPIGRKRTNVDMVTSCCDLYLTHFCDTTSLQEPQRHGELKYLRPLVAKPVSTTFTSVAYTNDTMLNTPI